MSESQRNYYQATANPRPFASTPLNDELTGELVGEANADVCIVGAGIAGCSAALHLAQRGYRVRVLEADTVGAGASGRSGGQLLPGYSCGQQLLTAQLGKTLSALTWQWSVEAVNLCKELIRTHHIACDLQLGHVDVAIRPRQIQVLRNWQAEMHDSGYTDTTLVEGSALQAHVGSTRYLAGLHDPHAAHLHPLNYTLGLAAAAHKAGATFHEHSRVQRFVPHADHVMVHTDQGQIRCNQLLLCANVGHDSLSSRLQQRFMAVGTYIIATEPLGDTQARALLPQHDCVCDINNILDYYRLSADHRLLFGGRVSYSGVDFFDTAAATRQRMLKVYPQLKDVRIDYAWGGMLDISLNRAPDFGRLHNNVYYVQGFSGHGLALATLAGQLLADTLQGQRERFDVYARIKHQPFPGGAWFRTPALMLAMLWYRLQDLL